MEKKPINQSTKTQPAQSKTDSQKQPARGQKKPVGFRTSKAFRRNAFRKQLISPARPGFVRETKSILSARPRSLGGHR